MLFFLYLTETHYVYTIIALHLLSIKVLHLKADYF